MKNRNPALKKFIREVPIPITCGRPERETIIKEDDILNLQIALNTAKSIDEFVEMV